MATLSTIALHPGAIGEIAFGEFLDVPAGGDTTLTVDAIVTAIFAKKIAPGVTFQTAIATIYAQAVGADVLEGILSTKDAQRLMLAALVGKRAGIGTGTEQYFAQDGTTPRVTLSADDAGNGTPVLNAN